MESEDINLRCYTKPDHLPHEPCDFDAACSGTYDFEYANTGLINWRVTYHEACLSDHIISILGSCYFAGFLVGSAIFMTLSDYTGRKVILLSGLAIQAFLNILILSFPWFNFLFIYEFFLGMKMPMSCHMSFMLLGEFISEKHRSVFSTLNNAFDGLNNIWISLYLYYVGVWQYWYIGNIVELCVIFTLILLLIPESPRNLLARKKFAAARKVYKRIATLNRRPMFSAKFPG